MVPDGAFNPPRADQAIMEFATARKMADFQPEQTGTTMPVRLRRTAAFGSGWLPGAAGIVTPFVSVFRKHGPRIQ